MNIQERDLLQSFLREVSQSRPSQKDPLAQSMIHSALGANPDALYLLAQRALAAEIALQRHAGALTINAPGLHEKPSGLGSFLGTVAGVATGVVAGGFLFEGVQSVLRDTGLEENLSNESDALGDITDWA
jgi:uncharacterized protein